MKYDVSCGLSETCLCASDIRNYPYYTFRASLCILLAKLFPFRVRFGIYEVRFGIIEARSGPFQSVSVSRDTLDTVLKYNT